MYCPSCGKQNPDDAKFCESCGASTGAGNGTNQPKAAPPPPPPPPPQQPPQQSYTPPPTQQPQQQTYYQQPPAYQAAATSAKAGVMSVGSYLGTIILLGIPLVGFILMLVWAFGSDVNPNKKNLCRAMLILAVIGIVLAIVFGGIMASLLGNLFNELTYY